MPDPEKITGLRISAAARQDIAEIWLFTSNRWSTIQADAYVVGLEALLDEIVDHPFGPAERTELKPPRRARHYQSHAIIYRIEDTMILVDRVLHGRRNWVSILSKEDPS